MPRRTTTSIKRPSVPLVSLATGMLLLFSGTASASDDLPDSNVPGSSPGSSIPGSSTQPSGGYCSFGFSNVDPEDPDAGYAEAASAGAERNRVPFGWRTLEPRQGEYNWERLDHRVDESLRHGMAPMLQIGGANNRAEAGFTLDDFSKAVEAVTERYRGKVHSIEIWNEPHIRGFWNTGPDIDEYAAMLEAGYEGAKAGNPDVTVISAGVGTTNFSPPNIAGRDWFQGMVDREAFDYADAIGVHPYSYPSLPSSGIGGGWKGMKNFIIPLLEDNGYGDKKIWVTEVGSPTRAEYPDDNDSVMDDAHQEQAYREYLDDWKELDDKIEAVFFFTLKDKDKENINAAEATFGVKRIDNSNKPAYDVLQDCNSSDFPGSSAGSTPGSSLGSALGS